MADPISILREKKQEAEHIVQQLSSEIAKLEAKRAEYVKQIRQLDVGIAAMRDALISPNGERASRNAIAHFARLANADVQQMTMKQLVIKALSENYPSGATANQLLDHFAMYWGRTDIMRSSLSPQLSRLKDNDGLIELHGRVWKLVRNENGPPNGGPEAGLESAATLPSQKFNSNKGPEA